MSKLNQNYQDAGAKILGGAQQAIAAKLDSLNQSYTPFNPARGFSISNSDVFNRFRVSTVRQSSRDANTLYSRYDAVEDAVDAWYQSKGKAAPPPGPERDKAREVMVNRFNANAALLRGASKAKPRQAKPDEEDNGDRPNEAFGMVYPNPPNARSIRGNGRALYPFSKADPDNTTAASAADNFAYLFMLAKQASANFTSTTHDLIADTLGSYGDMVRRAGRESGELQEWPAIVRAHDIRFSVTGKDLTAQRELIVAKLIAVGLSAITTAPECFAKLSKLNDLLLSDFGGPALQKGLAKVACADIHREVEKFMFNSVNLRTGHSIDIASVAVAVEPVHSDHTRPTDYIVTSRQEVVDNSDAVLNALRTAGQTAAVNAASPDPYSGKEILAQTFKMLLSLQRDKNFAALRAAVMDVTAGGSNTVDVNRLLELSDDMTRVYLAQNPAAAKGLLAEMQARPFTSGVNTRLLDAFKENNANLVRFRAEWRSKAPRKLLESLALLVGIQPHDLNPMLDELLTETEENTVLDTLTYLCGQVVVTPRILLANSFAHFVCQSPVKQTNGKFNRVNLTNLRCYMESQLRGAFPNADRAYNYPADFSVPSNRLTELMDRRKQAGIKDVSNPSNDYGMSVNRDGSVFYLPEFDAVKQQPVAEEYERLMVARETLLAKLGLPPTQEYDRERLTNYIEANFPETETAKKHTVTGSTGMFAAADLTPTQMLLPDAKEVVERLLQITAALAGMKHQPLFSSQTFGHIVYPDPTAETNYNYHPLKANGRLTDSALQEVRQGKRADVNQRCLFRDFTALSPTSDMLPTIALMYATLAEYGEVPRVEDLLGSGSEPGIAVNRWQETSGFNWNGVTAIELTLRERTKGVVDVQLPYTAAGVYDPDAVVLSREQRAAEVSLFSIDPASVPAHMVEKAKDMYLSAQARDNISRQARALLPVLQFAQHIKKGVAGNEAFEGAAMSFMRQIATRLVNRTTGQTYTGQVTATAPDFYLKAFDDTLPVALRADIDQDLIDALMPRNGDRSQMLVEPGRRAAGADAGFDDELPGQNDVGETGSFDEFKEDGGIAEGWLDNADNPFSFFGVYRKTNVRKDITRYQGLLSTTVTGIAYMEVMHYLFNALRKDDSIFGQTFFPLVQTQNLAIDQQTGEQTLVAGQPQPMCNYDTFFRKLMPTLFAGMAFERNYDTIGSRFKANTGGKMTNNLTVATFDEQGRASKEKNFLEVAKEFTVFNMKPDTRLIRHQLRTIYNTTADPDNLPQCSIHAVAPGGGKTIIGLTQLMRVVGLMAQRGVVARPLVVSPPKLIKNWVEDAAKFFGTNVNVYPLATETLNSMPASFVRAIVENAPPNTVFITSYSFLTGNNSAAFMVGANLIEVRANLDYILSFGFTDVYFDEAHKGKNSDDNPLPTVLAMASLAQQKGCRVTLATGTVFNKDIKDINGILKIADPGLALNVDAFMEVFTASGSTNQVEREEVIALREYANRITSYNYVSEDNWRFARPTINYHTHVVNPMVFAEAEQHDIEAMMKKRFSPDFDTPYWEAMRWMCEHKFFGPDSDAALQSLVASDETFNAAYRALLLKEMDAFKEALADSKNAEDVDDTFGDEGVTDGDEDDEEGDKKKVRITAEESLMNRMLIRIIQLVNDPQGDGINGSELIGTDGVKRKVVLDRILSPKMRMAAYLVLRHFTDENAKFNVTNDNIKGRKVVVVGENVRTIMAFQRALAEVHPELRGRCRMYVGSKPTSASGHNDFLKKEIDDLDMHEIAGSRSAFEQDDNVWILCATEASLSEGFNLQISNRMIRLDSPWTAGRVKQTKARIDRPDLAGTVRDYADIDWILCDNSLEILRYARIVSRVIEGAIYDNSDKEEFAALDVMPKFSMTSDRINTMSRYASLAHVVEKVKQRQPGGTVLEIEREYNYIKGLEDVYRAERAAGERQLAADFALADSLGLLREYTRPDGRVVKRPELMATPNVQHMQGSRPLLFTPAVPYTDNSRLQEYGFQTYNLNTLVNDYEIDTPEFLGRHVYTQYGFARICQFTRLQNGGEYGPNDSIPVATVRVIFPNGSYLRLPVAQVTLLENVQPDNPNLWMLNSMLDIQDYAFGEEGSLASPSTKVMHYSVDPATEKVTIKEVEWDDDAAQFNLKPSTVKVEDYMEPHGITAQLRPIFDNGFARTGKEIREVAEIHEGDVLLLDGELFVVQPALELKSGANNATLLVKLYPIGTDGQRKTGRGGKPVPPRLVPYDQFAANYGYLIKWQSDKTTLIQAALADRFARRDADNIAAGKQPVIKDRDISIPKLADGQTVVGPRAPSVDVTLTSLDMLRMASGRPPLNPNLPKGCEFDVVADPDDDNLVMFELFLPYTDRSGNQLSVKMPAGITEAMALEQVLQAGEGNGGEPLTVCGPINKGKTMQINVIGNDNAPVGLPQGTNLGNVNTLLEEGDGQIDTGGDVGAIMGGAVPPTKQPIKPTPVQPTAPAGGGAIRPTGPAGSGAPSAQPSTPPATTADLDDSTGLVRADALQVILGQHGGTQVAMGLATFTTQQGVVGNEAFLNVLKDYPTFDVVNNRMVPKRDMSGKLKTSDFLLSLDVMMVPVEDRDMLMGMVKAMTAPGSGLPTPTQGTNALTHAFLTNPVQYMGNVFNDKGQVHAHVRHVADAQAKKALDKIFPRKEDAHAQQFNVLPAIYRTARSNGEQLYLLVRAAPGYANKVKRIAVRDFGIPAGRVVMQRVLLSPQTNIDSALHVLRMGEALFGGELNKRSLANANRDLKSIKAGDLSESGAGDRASRRR